MGQAARGRPRERAINCMNKFLHELAVSTIEELEQEQHCCYGVENDKKPEEKTIILFAGFCGGLWGLLHDHLLENVVRHAGKPLGRTHVDAGKNRSRQDSQQVAGERITNLKRCSGCRQEEMQWWERRLMKKLSTVPTKLHP